MIHSVANERCSGGNRVQQDFFKICETGRDGATPSRPCGQRSPPTAYLCEELGICNPCATGNGRGNEMYRLVGRDVPGAPRAWGRHRDANGNASGTRAAGDVGPYHAPRHVRPRTPGPHTHGMRTSGRARRARRAARMGPLTEQPRGRPSGRGPPGTSAPTRRYHATRGLTCFPQRFR